MPSSTPCRSQRRDVSPPKALRHIGPPRCFRRPEAIAALSADDRAIEGQPTSTQEAIAKRIIELAAVGSATLGSCARVRLLCVCGRSTAPSID